MTEPGTLRRPNVPVGRVVPAAPAPAWPDNRILMEEGMSCRVGGGIALAAALAAAGPALAQRRSLVVEAVGGGYSPLENLTTTAPASDFKTGFNLGGQVGMQGKHLGVYGDFTFARAMGRGDPEIAGFEFNRYFYGAHVELRQPTASGLTPFVLGGAGGITVSETGTGTVPSFTKGAGLFGAGLGYLIPKSRVELLAEGRGVAYKFDAGGFNRGQVDMTYSLGIGYRFRT